MTIEPKTLADELGVENLEEALKYLRDQFIKNTCETERRDHCALIDAMLEHKATYAVHALMLKTHVDTNNREELRQLEGACEVNALLSRVVGEQATAYDEPAERAVSTGSEKFAALQKALQADLVLRAALKRLVAHEAIWLSLRVRDDVPVLDVVSPAKFWAVSPVGDPTALVGIITEIPQPPKPTDNTPAFRFSGRWQTLVLNSKCELLRAEDNALAPSLPGVLISLEPVSVTQKLLPERPSADLASAETSASFQVLLSLRESLVPSRQVYVSGDSSSTTMGQTASSSREVFLGEGVSVTNVTSDISAKPYLENAEAIADTASANYGLAPSSRKLADASSGYEMWLRQAPLVKRRRQLIDVLREGERALWTHAAQVIDVVGLEQYKFSADGFAITFGEVSMVQSEAEELQNFETRRRLNLDDTQSEIARRGQLTEEQAAEDLSVHVQREVARITLLQDLSAMNANSATTVGDQTNGNAAPQSSENRNTTIQ